MSSPTVIRHAQTEGRAALVITYFDRVTHGAAIGSRFSVAFQTYAIGLKEDSTSLIHTSIWDTEERAIAQFDAWRAEHIGDMPGNF